MRMSDRRQVTSRPMVTKNAIGTYLLDHPFRLELVVIGEAPYQGPFTLPIHCGVGRWVIPFWTTQGLTVLVVVKPEAIS